MSPSPSSVDVGKLSDYLGVRMTDGETLRHMAQMVLSNHLGRTSMMESIYKVLLGSPDVWKKEDPEVEAAVSDGATPPGMRLRVLFRDGHACRSCGGRHNLQVHHVVWRSRGGKTEMGNLITLCSRCHGLVHEELMRIEREDGGSGFRDRWGRSLEGPVRRGGLQLMLTAPDG